MPCLDLRAAGLRRTFGALLSQGKDHSAAAQAVLHVGGGKIRELPGAPGMAISSARTVGATMSKTFAIVSVLVLVSGAALAHHGWGSSDAAKPITVAGPIVTSKYENPHATITVRAADKVRTVTLAPTSRMTTRGANAQVVAIGKTVSAYGYASTTEKDEMRAERITVDGKTYEMR